MSIVVVLARTDIETLAGYRAYARGVSYQAEGRVELRSLDDDGVEATVQGTLPYWVEVRADGGRLDWSCSCPAAEDGSFCKHCVAVACAAAERALNEGRLEASGRSMATATDPPRRRTAPSHPAPPQQPPEVDFAAYVGSLDHRELVSLVLAQAETDRRLHDRLLAHAAAEIGAGIDERGWRRRLEEAFSPHSGYTDYWDAAGWASGVQAAIRSIGDLVDAGHAAAAARLAEHAHRLAEDAVAFVDDSDGWLSEISAEIGAVHLHACTESAPDPVELARRLTDLELSSELDAFHRAAVTYADVLGRAGLAEYRRIVEPALAALGPRDGRWSSGRYRLQEARNAIAVASNDPDELIRAKQADLVTPGDYHEVAELLRSCGRLDEAVTWARNGLDACADSTHQLPRLRDLLAELLRLRGDPAGALDVYWQGFERHPSLETYRRLQVEASRSEASDEMARRAVEVVEVRIRGDGPQREPDRGGAHPVPGRAQRWPTVLVEILLHDGEIEPAWETASAHGCDERLWASLAHARAATHPLDAIIVHRRHALTAIERRNRRGYTTAVDLLDRVRRLAEKADQPHLFAQLLTEVRTTHRAKRSLMAMLDQRGWTSTG